jgi:hypothetical protein
MIHPLKPAGAAGTAGVVGAAGTGGVVRTAGTGGVVRAVEVVEVGGEDFC